MQYPIINLFLDAYFANGWTGLDIPSTIEISSKQLGNGEPSLSNIRKIIPGAKLNINGEFIEVYDGILDTINKTLTVNSFLYWYDGSEYWVKSGTALNGYYNYLAQDSQTPHNFPSMSTYVTPTILTFEKSNMFILTVNPSEYFNTYYMCLLDSGMNFNVPIEVWGNTVTDFNNKLSELYNNGNRLEVLTKIRTPIVYNLSDSDFNGVLESIGYGIAHRLKLPLSHYFPHPVIAALQRAAAGAQTADDIEILRHYLTPLGIGGI